MTNAEKLLWQRIRKKQILGIQFYRQKPLFNFIVDFFAPKPKIIIEADGSQHLEEEHFALDQLRDEYFFDFGFKVLRYDNFQILRKIDEVIEDIYNAIIGRL